MLYNICVDYQSKQSKILACNFLIYYISGLSLNKLDNGICFWKFLKSEFY